MKDNENPRHFQL